LLLTGKDRFGVVVVAVATSEFLFVVEVGLVICCSAEADEPDIEEEVFAIPLGVTRTTKFCFAPVDVVRD